MDMDVIRSFSKKAEAFSESLEEMELESTRNMNPEDLSREDGREAAKFWLAAARRGCMDCFVKGLTLEETKLHEMVLKELDRLEKIYGGECCRHDAFFYARVYPSVLWRMSGVAS